MSSTAESSSSFSEAEFQHKLRHCDVVQGVDGVLYWVPKVQQNDEEHAVRNTDDAYVRSAEVCPGSMQRNPHYPIQLPFQPLIPPPQPLYNPPIGLYPPGSASVPSTTMPSDRAAVPMMMIPVPPSTATMTPPPVPEGWWWNVCPAAAAAPSSNLLVAPSPVLNQSFWPQPQQYVGGVSPPVPWQHMSPPYPPPHPVTQFHQPQWHQQQQHRPSQAAVISHLVQLQQNYPPPSLAAPPRAVTPVSPINNSTSVSKHINHHNSFCSSRSGSNMLSLSFVSQNTPPLPTAPSQPLPFPSEHVTTPSKSNVSPPAAAPERLTPPSSSSTPPPNDVVANVTTENAPPAAVPGAAAAGPKAVGSTRSGKKGTPKYQPSPVTNAPSRTSASAQNGVGLVIGNAYTGIVKRYNTARGFGFLRTEDGLEIFVHQSCIEMDGYRGLNAGAEVTFTVGMVSDTLQATNVVQLTPFEPPPEDDPPVATKVEDVVDPVVDETLTAAIQPSGEGNQ